MSIHALPVSPARPSRRSESAVARTIVHSIFIYAAFGLSVVFSLAVIFGILN